MLVWLAEEGVPYVVCCICCEMGRRKALDESDYYLEYPALLSSVASRGRSGRKKGLAERNPGSILTGHSLQGIIFGPLALAGIECRFSCVPSPHAFSLRDMRSTSQSAHSFSILIPYSPIGKADMGAQFLQERVAFRSWRSEPKPF